MLLMLLSVLLWSLSVNNCQIVTPYLSLHGQNLTNHSYVDLNEVGHTVDNSVQCRTDLKKCCSGAQGILRGDWHFPDGMRVTLDTNNRFYETRGAQSVNLHRPSWAKSPTGIFYCQIPYGSNNTSMNEILYIGLYDTGAGIIS